MERTIIQCANCERVYLGVVDDRGETRIIGGRACRTCGSAELAVIEKDEL